MDWSTPEDERLLGSFARQAKEAAELAIMLDAMPQCLGVPLDGSRVAWLRVTKAGKVTCVGIAPDDGRRSMDYAEMFAAPLPEDWLTKGRAGLFVRKADQHPDWKAFQENGFAFGVLPDRRAVLVKVRRIVAGQPEEVLPHPEADWMPRASYIAPKLFGLTKYVDGAEELWRTHVVVFKGYRTLTYQLWARACPEALAESRKAGLEAAKAARAAKKSAKAATR